MCVLALCRTFLTTSALDQLLYKSHVNILKPIGKIITT
jgi:hypothetical protein